MNDIDYNIFKFKEDQARLFKINESSYIITAFDVSAVAEYYNIDMLEALEKISESHNINFNDIDILYEFSFYSEEQIKRLINEQEQQIERYEYLHEDDKVQKLKLSLQRLKNQLHELEMKAHPHMQPAY